MQWLIDLIIEKIGIPPTYIYRGDPTEYDFNLGDFTVDYQWHPLDLSAIVPAGAKGVGISIVARPIAVPMDIQFRRGGQVDAYNWSGFMTKVAGNQQKETFMVACDENRIVDYRIETGGVSAMEVVIICWWL
ncbi:hypothetical protein ES703_75287 [subsurface metagenome]